jgi:hypothetical protein
MALLSSLNGHSLLYLTLAGLGVAISLRMLKRAVAPLRAIAAAIAPATLVALATGAAFAFLLAALVSA